MILQAWNMRPSKYRIGPLLTVVSDAFEAQDRVATGESHASHDADMTNMLEVLGGNAYSSFRATDKSGDCHNVNSWPSR